MLACYRLRDCFGAWPPMVKVMLIMSTHWNMPPILPSAILIIKALRFCSLIQVRFFSTDPHSPRLPSCGWGSVEDKGRREGKGIGSCAVSTAGYIKSYNWSAKQQLHRQQGVVETTLSEDKSRQCETSFGSHHRNMHPVSISFYMQCSGPGVTGYFATLVMCMRYMCTGTVSAWCANVYCRTFIQCSNLRSASRLILDKNRPNSYNRSVSWESSSMTTSHLAHCSAVSGLNS